MTDWTPTTTHVRDAYVRQMRDAFVASTGEHEAEFDRWLRQVQAQAWAEGERHESDYLSMFGQFCSNPINPYLDVTHD